MVSVKEPRRVVSHLRFQPIWAKLFRRYWEPLFAGSLIVITVGSTLGIFIPSLGLYLDDYVSWFLSLRLGTPALIEFAAGQSRPLIGLLPLLAQSVIGAHLWVFISHTLNGILILLLLRTIRPEQRVLSTLSALLYCVYPAYWWHPQYISLNIDLAITFVLLSLFLSVLAVRQVGIKRYSLTSVSVLLMIGYFFLYEQPFGYELLRPVLFFLISSGSTKRRVWKSFIGTFPWLFVTALLFLFRVVVFKPFGYFGRANYNLVSLPSDGQGIITRFQNLITALLDQFVNVWENNIQVFRQMTPGSSSGYIVIVFTLILSCGIYLWFTRKQPTEKNRFRVMQMCFVGILIAVLGQVTVIIGANIQPTATGQASRWNLVPSIGIALVWVSCIFFVSDLSGHRFLKTIGRIIVISAIGLGAFLHILNVQDYIRDWEAQRQLWWQLAWRAPSLAPQTLILLDGSTSIAQSRPRYSYETMTSAALFYGESNEIASLTTTEALLFRDAPYYFWRIDADTYDLGLVQWTIDFEKSLLINIDEGCIEVVTPHVALPEGKRLSVEGEQLRSLIPDPTSIILAAESSFPHRFLFEPEPEHDWCYYYLQAQYAIQIGDFDYLASLRQTVLALGLQPVVQSEWEIFHVDAE